MYKADSLVMFSGRDIRLDGFSSDNCRTACLPRGILQRLSVNIRSSDVVIIIGGRSCTLGEFSIAYDEGKLIGVLLGTGGITAEIKNIVKIVKKKTGAKIIYGKDQLILVKELLDYYTTEHQKHPSVHHDYNMSSSTS